jgi:hypothetical protein
MVLNIPVVPTGSSLQDPQLKGTNVAAVGPTMVYYRGQEVQTFVFEVTDASAAAFFADTRSGLNGGSTTAAAGRQANGLEIPVVSFASTTFVSAIPLWHVNQFSNGVVEGQGGGPNPLGMRNVINLDRPDPGYSPLWNILWATEMPIDYTADQFSNAGQATAANGFTFFPTPMYVNCPDIGLVGDVNTLKSESFETVIMTGCGDTNFMIIGSAPSIILTADQPITLVAEPSGATVGETVTNMMGGYEYDLASSDIPEGTTEIVVMANGESIRSIEVMAGGDCGSESTAAGVSLRGGAVLAATASLLAMVIV